MAGLNYAGAALRRQNTGERKVVEDKQQGEARNEKAEKERPFVSTQMKRWDAANSGTINPMRR